MIGAGIAKKAAGAAMGAALVAVDVARHAAWYVSYQAGGTAREADEPPERD
jgi:hypothetical protein